MYSVSLVPETEVPKVWATTAPMLNRAIETTERRRLSIADLYEQCLSGESALWIVFDGKKEIISCFTTAFLQYPGYKALSVQYLGGRDRKLAKWLPDAMRVIKSFAMATGCETIEGYGREGWGRALRTHGFERVYTMFEVDLSKEAMSQAAE